VELGVGGWLGLASTLLPTLRRASSATGGGGELVAGGWELVAGSWWLGAGGWELVAGGWLGLASLHSCQL
jgi:hypothetical protein